MELGIRSVVAVVFVVTRRMGTPVGFSGGSAWIPCVGEMEPLLIRWFWFLGSAVVYGSSVVVPGSHAPARWSFFCCGSSSMCNCYL
ncbi:hypothetical protein TIFTF001_027724 [Ficus carica]|uniref:Uncharacterized protein n=1 Tax=Ficus carica TaxID=3494 RepID=A0AA88J037_FICCA|nr:hypothetical protein TIFTF001_027724 [Ficus carica]